MSTYSVQERQEREAYFSGVSVNPVRFLPSPNILKANFAYSEQGLQKKGIILVASELIQ
jgi:hypothetical protein